MSSIQIRPYALHCEEGKRLSAFGARITFKATAEQTGGIFNLFDVSCPPGFATDMHIHSVEDVAVYVLEGALTFFWGSEKRRRGPVLSSSSRAGRRKDFGLKVVLWRESFI